MPKGQVPFLFFNFKQFFTEATLDYSRLWTWFVGLEGKRADHWTTTLGHLFQISIWIVLHINLNFVVLIVLFYFRSKFAVDNGSQLVTERDGLIIELVLTASASAISMNCEQ